MLTALTTRLSCADIGSEKVPDSSLWTDAWGGEGKMKKERNSEEEKEERGEEDLSARHSLGATAVDAVTRKALSAAGRSGEASHGADTHMHT